MAVLENNCVFKLMLRILPVVILAATLALPKGANGYQREHIIIIASPGSSFQLDTAAAIRENLEAINIRASIISHNNIDSSPTYENTAYIAIGQTAIAAFESQNIEAPVLRISDKKQPDANYTSAKASLILEQPICRNIPLIKALDQNWESIAFLSSLNSIDKASELTKCAIKHNINIQVYAISDDSDLLQTLEMAVDNNDVLLSVPDPLIYNNRTVKNILLTSYRLRKPIIGYSEIFVDAGAIAAVYTSSTSAGKRAAQIISEFIDNNWQFKNKVYYPTDFTVSTNRQVAKSLDITFPDNTTILNNIIRMENQ